MNERELIESRRLSPPPGEEFWIFAYGSLMWNPGFSFRESHPALLRGYHRAFCVSSEHYRGTPEKPGLVLGLDRGGACRGRAYRIAAAHRKSVCDYLHEREMLSGVYDPRWLKVRLLPAADSPMEVPGRAGSAAPRTVTAAAYVADRGHEQYCRFSPDQVAARIRQGVGSSGTNLAYLENTVRHLDELGIAEGPLHDLLRMATAPRRG
jgi:glutathione-specific gamma-glutamylcyclotransferase